MTTLTSTEENYLKAIFVLSGEATGKVANHAIAERLEINPATVTEMLRKLRDKALIEYSRSEGVSLSRIGIDHALKIVRKHRLWETFLVKKLEFTWDEVHDIAEQSEHLHSEKLVEQLDKFLGYPEFDPHGDPIPDKNGKLPNSNAAPLSERRAGKKYRLAGVANHSPAFLKLLDKLDIAINDTIELKEVQEFDKAVIVILNGKHKTSLSWDISRNLLVV